METTIYVPNFWMDLQSTPGGRGECNSKGYLDKETCEREVQRLNTELEKEFGFPDRKTFFKDWVTNVRNDEGDECVGLSDQEVIDNYGIEDRYEEEIERVWEEDNHSCYHNFDCSSPPHWSTQTIEIVDMVTSVTS